MHDWQPYLLHLGLVAAELVEPVGDEVPEVRLVIALLCVLVILWGNEGLGDEGPAGSASFLNPETGTPLTQVIMCSKS